MAFQTWLLNPAAPGCEAESRIAQRVRGVLWLIDRQGDASFRAVNQVLCNAFLPPPASTDTCSYFWLRETVATSYSTIAESATRPPRTIATRSSALSTPYTCDPYAGTHLIPPQSPTPSINRRPILRSDPSTRDKRACFISWQS